MSKQISEYFQPFFSKFQWGLRKILAPSSVFCQCLRSGNRELDLFKAIDCLSRDLFSAKLNAYGFSIDSLRLVEDFVKSQTKNLNKFNIQLMGRNYIRSSPGIHFRASFVYLLFMWFVFHYECHWFYKLHR